MATRVMWIVVAVQVVSGSEYYRNEGFMDHVSNGIKIAQNVLGSESVALKVADFVVRAFNTVNAPRGSSGSDNPGTANTRRPTQGGHVEEHSSSDRNSFEQQRPQQTAADDAPWRYLLRLLGLQPNQLSAVAVNALVFVAQMITSFLATPRRPGKPYRSEDPTHWILNKNSQKLQDIIATAKNDSLANLVDELVTEYDTPEETSCIRLLVCKVTPFVKRMQDTVFKKSDGNTFTRDVRGAAVLYRHLPSNEEIRDKSDACERRFPDCELNE